MYYHDQDKLAEATGLVDTAHDILENIGELDTEHLFATHAKLQRVDGTRSGCLVAHAQSKEDLLRLVEAVAADLRQRLGIIHTGKTPGLN